MLQLPLLRNPQNALLDAGRSDHRISGRFRNLGRNVRSTDLDPNRPHGAGAVLVVRQGFLGWHHNWDVLADAGTISADDLELFKFVETAEEAIEALENWEGKGEKRGEIPGR